MAKYLDVQIREALDLRKKHKYSFKELAEITHIPATTIRNWCKNEITGTRWDTLLISNEMRRQEHKNSEVKAIDKIQKLDSNLTKIFASLLYWCEGSKYPAENRIDFVNSDPILIQLFVALLRKSFNLNEEKFRVQLQIHTTHSYRTVRKYWSDLLLIPEKQFLKPTITTPRGGKHRIDYLGTCSVRYSDFKIQLKLIGVYEALSKRLIQNLLTA